MTDRPPSALPPPLDSSLGSLLVPPFVAWSSVAEREANPVPASAALPCVPGYRIVEALGEGGMGIVYKAEQIRLKRLVALKMIPPARAGRRLRERFRREAEAVARLQHPNIVQIYEVGDCDGCPFLSLEYVDGGSLAHRLDGRPLDPRQAAGLLLTLAQAIHYAHERGIVHRDLKPANILLACTAGSAWDSSAKITDFGLAKHLDEDAALSREGDVLGTPAYMAPEQAGGRGSAVGPATDVHALGAILYEMLTGRPPFLAATVEEMVKQVCQQDAVPPSRLVSRLPRDLDTMCLTCLAKDPSRRYASAAALADDLRRFLDGEAIHARPMGRLEIAARWMRRHPAPATLFACLLLAVVALAVAIPFYIHLLNARVRASTEEIQRLHRENLRVTVLSLLKEGHNARQRDEWADARMRFTEVLDHLEEQPDLLDDELRRRQDEARAELTAVDGRLAEEKAETERRRNYRELFRWRDEAFFLLNRDLFTPAAASPSESIEAARHGLALFGMAADAVRVPDLRGYRAAEQDKLRAGLFELLLIEAEARARPAAEQTPAQRNQQLDHALTLLDRAAALSVDASSVHVRRARYLRLRGRVAEAEQEQRRAAEATPRTALGWFLRGYDRQRDDGHRREAIQAFEEALHCQSDLFWAHFLRALAYQKQGQPGEARASLTVCVARRADFVWNYLLRGLVFMELGDLQAAQADFARAESLPRDGAASYVLHLNRGTLSLKEHKAADAVRHFEKAAGEQPHWYQAAVNLAEAHGQLQQFDQAVRWLDRAIQLEANKPALYRARALMEQRRDRPAAALADLEQALRRLPSDGPSLERARYHFERGAILFLDNQGRAALQALDASLAALPGRTEGAGKSQDRERERLAANAQLLRAQTLLKRNEPRKARAALDAYLKHGPATASVWRQRAAIDLKLGDYNGVLEDCSRALGPEPNDADTLCLRGGAYLHLRLPQSALRDFEKALSAQPGHVDALLWRGLAHVHNGDLVAGIDDARRAVKLKPDAEVKVRAARVFAQAVAAEPREAAEYEVAAVQLLRRAVQQFRAGEEQQKFWSDRIRDDNALSPIMRSAAFRALEQEVGRMRR